MTPADRAAVRELVERSCREQGIAIVVPAAVCAQLLAGAQAEAGDDASAA